MGLSLGSIVGVSGGRSRVILVLRGCIWNAPVVSFVLQHLTKPAPWVLQCVSGPSTGSMVSPWVTAPHFLVVTREAELKLTTSS